MPPDSTDFHVTYHVGSPSLCTTDQLFSLDDSLINFAHVGFWSKRRYLEDVLREFEQAHQENPRLSLHQFGPIEPGTEKELAQKRWITVRAGMISPRMSTAILESENINLVIDQNDRTPYCPYLPSKFAYAVKSRRPILAIGQLNSEMGKLFQEYRCFYFADIRQPGSLCTALLEISRTPPDHLLRPCYSLNKIFDSENVASNFTEKISKRIITRGLSSD